MMFSGCHGFCFKRKSTTAELIFLSCLIQDGDDVDYKGMKRLTFGYEPSI
jgi:hypothetical protein